MSLDNLIADLCGAIPESAALLLGAGFLVGLHKLGGLLGQDRQCSSFKAYGIALGVAAVLSLPGGQIRDISGGDPLRGSSSGLLDDLPPPSHGRSSAVVFWVLLVPIALGVYHGRAYSATQSAAQ